MLNFIIIIIIITYATIAAAAATSHHISKENCNCKVVVQEDEGEQARMGNETLMAKCNETDALIIVKMPINCNPHVILSQLFNPNLKKLNWHQTHMSILANDTLGGIVKIEQLNLTKNAIATIDSDTFKQLIHLSVIDLSYNDIESLSTVTFVGNTMLTHLYLGHNKLSILDLTLGSTKVMLLLHASHNLLTTVDLKDRTLLLPQKRLPNNVLHQQRHHQNNLTIMLDDNNLSNFSMSSAFQTNHVSLCRNNLRDLQVLSKLKPLTMESLNLENNDIQFLHWDIIGWSIKLKQLYLANNSLESIDISDLMKHFQRLKQISILQKHSWLCSDLIRTMDALKQAKIEFVDTPLLVVSSQEQLKEKLCFEPRHELNKLKETFSHKYTSLLLVFGCTTFLLCTIIVSLAIMMQNSLKRMRADSISKSFDIKIMPPPSAPPPPPPLPPENIYEENVYNHVYSDPNPTTTL